MSLSAGTWLMLASFALTISCQGDGNSRPAATPIGPTPVVGTTFPAVDGPWAGTYDAGCTGGSSCSGRSRLGDNLVSFAGAGLPVTLTLTQTGGQLTGSVEFTGVITIPVTGTVDAAGVMELSGSAVVDSVRVVLTNWRTTVTARTMTGSWLTRVERPSSDSTLVDARIRAMLRGGQPTPPPPPPVLTTIQEVLAGTVGTEGFIGQSVTVVGGPFNNVRFNWYRRFPRVPTVFGTLYVLTQEYLGPPSELSTATPGFVARSVRIEHEQYVFDPDVTLRSGVKYWFLNDLAGNDHSVTASDAYAGGDYYNAGNGKTYGRGYSGSPSERLDANFTLQGVPVGP